MWQLSPVQWSRVAVWCGHGSRVGAAGTKMAAQYPAQPSPAQPSPAVMSQSVASLCRPAGRAAVYTDTAPHINTALVLPPSLCGPEPPQRWSRLFCSAVRGPSRRSLSSSCSDPRRPSWLGRSSSSCYEVATWRGWCSVAGVRSLVSLPSLPLSSCHHHCLRCLATLSARLQDHNTTELSIVRTAPGRAAPSRTTAAARAAAGRGGEGPWDHPGCGPPGQEPGGGGL